MSDELDTVRLAALACTNCDLHQNATQTVFGQGPSTAPVMLVGEQPGDKEDLAGTPFVGPAGRLLDQALEEAGIDRSQAYVTNVVKHFKWKPQGKVRLHQKPNTKEIAACKPWLEEELRLVNPKFVVLMGATAAQALYGSTFRVTKQHGQFMDLPATLGESAGRIAMATVHPSSILRAFDEAARMEALSGMIADLSLVGKELRNS